MKLKRTGATALACLFMMLPAAACHNGDGEDTAQREEEPITEQLPETPLPPEEAPAVTEPPAETEPIEPVEPIEPIEPQEPSETEPEIPATKPTEPIVTEVPKTKTSEYLLIQTNGLNIRSGAGTSFSSLGTADKGSLMILSGRKGEWYQTRYKDRTAYVSAKYVTVYSVDVTDTKDEIESVIKRGFDFLGVKYVLGATRCHDGKGNKISGFTTTAFDCSSYMQYIFLYGAGKILDVTTRTQVLQGKSVPVDELRRGDLLFFTNASRVNKTGIERVGHVALYLGDNYILHTSSDYARAEQITPARWNYYLTARRMI